MKKLLKSCAFLLIAACCFGFFTAETYAAFDKNRLIDDGVFNNTGSLSAGEIDAFLNSRNSCISPNSGFRAVDPTGYSPSGGYQYGGYVTAGTVIAHAAQAYDLNPQVLLVTLQKEQSLITSTSCSTNTISKAVGYACPDNIESFDYSGLNLYARHGTTYTSVQDTCVTSAAKAGFSQQLIRAAWLLKFAQQRSLGNVNWAVIRGAWNNSDDPQSCYSGPMTEGWRQTCPSGPTVYYDGYISIDNQTVRPASGATAALYYYTPHFHGNQNFVSIWTDWFGGTIVNFDPLVTPRWMRAKQTTYKKDIATNANVEAALPSGTNLFMSTKITLGGTTYLRTAHDTAGNHFQGIPVTELEDIPYENMLYPRWMKLTAATPKKIPRQGINVGATLEKDRSIHFISKTTVNGVTYLRSEHDTTRAGDTAIPLSLLTDVTYEPMGVPRWMKVKKDLQKRDPLTGTATGSIIPAGTQLKFNSKITLAHNVFLRTVDDTTAGNAAAISLNDLEDNTFEPMVIPRTMQLNKPSYKFRITDLGQEAGPYETGTTIRFKSKIFINDAWYLRTEIDTSGNLPYVIPLSDLSDV